MEWTLVRIRKMENLYWRKKWRWDMSAPMRVRFHPCLLRLSVLSDVSLQWKCICLAREGNIRSCFSSSSLAASFSLKFSLRWGPGCWVTGQSSTTTFPLTKWILFCEFFFSTMINWALKHFIYSYLFVFGKPKFCIAWYYCLTANRRNRPHLHNCSRDCFRLSRIRAAKSVDGNT